MAAVHCSCKMLLSGTFNATSLRATLPPSFLLPAFSGVTQTASFCSSSHQQARKDGNPWRGLSALRRTGLGTKVSLSVKLKNLPKPVRDPAKRSAVQVDEDHGLWQFLPGPEKPIFDAADLNAHGRSWAVAELRKKDWDDLYRLWWVCVKERNRIETSEYERKRTIPKGYGEHEYENRLKEVKKTMKAIKVTLLERWYAYDNARFAAMSDPEINLYADPEKGENPYRLAGLPRQDVFEARSHGDEQAPGPQA